ncbi:MAG: serine O-acetyltransferase [Deltaproteobacteria bacterium]|nr:serine O-acetyltransferase [Deltaproteobacteria bacterium]
MTDNANDVIWQQIREEAKREAEFEPALASFLYTVVLSHELLEDALSYILASKLGCTTVNALTLRDLINAVFSKDLKVCTAFRADLQAVLSRDPACCGYLIPLLYFKGFQALQAYRVANYYFVNNRKALAYHIQSRVSEVFAVDIHPGARIGKGILFDHATSVVVGETAVVDDDCSLLHEVTLGGTGKDSGDRHPKVHRGVMIGAGAKILGNIVIGEGAKIGSGSVVLKDVPPHCTVAGVPARQVGAPTCDLPALEMDQSLEL